jgi:hypothetical protein
MVQTNAGMHVSMLMHSEIKLKEEIFLERFSNYHLHEQECVPLIYERLALFY